VEISACLVGVLLIGAVPMPIDSSLKACKSTIVGILKNDKKIGLVCTGKYIEERGQCNQ